MIVKEFYYRMECDLEVETVNGIKAVIPFELSSKDREEVNIETAKEQLFFHGTLVRVNNTLEFIEPEKIKTITFSNIKHSITKERKLK